MAIEFIEGFDHYTSEANLNLKWGTSTNVGAIIAGRFGGQCVRTGASDPLISKSLGAVATRTVGWALRYEAGTPTGTPVVMAFLDGTSTQVDLRIDPTRHLVVTRNGTVLATSTATISQDTWYYVEFQVTIHASAGAYRLDVTASGAMTTWLSATGVNTQATANATTDGFKILGGVGFWLNTDDLYAGSALLGECRVFTSLPNAETAATSTNQQWTPNSGTTHYTQVDDSNPDGDTSYVASSVTDQIDTYRFPSISASGVIHAVQETITARKDDAAARGIVAEYRSSGGTNYAGSTAMTLTTTYAMYRHIWETDPATSAAWTPTGVNNGEFGVKCTA